MDQTDQKNIPTFACYTNIQGLTPMYFAAEKGHPGVMKTLIEAKSTQCGNCLMVAAINDNRQCLELLTAEVWTNDDLLAEGALLEETVVAGAYLRVMLDEVNEGQGSTGGPEVAARFARDVELTMLRSDADDVRTRSLCLRTLAWLCRSERP